MISRAAFSVCLSVSLTALAASASGVRTYRTKVGGEFREIASYEPSPYSGEGARVIDLDAAGEKWRFLGLGTSFAEASCRLIRSLPEPERTALVRRLFGKDGHDETAEDACEIYRMTAKGARKDGPLTRKRDEAMGRIRCAENFIRVLQGREEPLSDPSEAVKLMRIIDAVYVSARTGRPVKV